MSSGSLTKEREREARHAARGPMIGAPFERRLLREALAEIDAMRKALRFYADPDTYCSYADIEETWPPWINEDRGKVAREALAAGSEGGTG